MKKKQKTLVFFISLLYLSSLISESSITNANACTNFKVKDDENVFFGNSEDHAFNQISDTFITFVPRGQTWYDGSKLRYGAVIVGYANGSGNSWFQGGMNEKGVAFDSTSVPHTEPNLHDERLPFLVPEIFCCESISEIIEDKNTHSVYQQEGSIQSFYVDKSGESVVFHIGEDGEYNFIRDNGRLQLATNYYVDDPSRGNPGSDAIRRYDAAEQILINIVSGEEITIESIKSVLDAVHFEGPAVNTLYSNIFDVTNGDVYLYYFHQFGEVVKLNLEEELAKGRHAYRISGLFTQEIVDNAFNEYHEFPFIIRVIPTDILLLLTTTILDIILVLTSIFVVGKKIFPRTRESDNEVMVREVNSKEIYIHVIPSLAIIWSFLCFPMIYWNHKGEWWPFFDGVPIISWPLQSFYASHNLFLLMSLLGVVLTAFLLSSFTRRRGAIQLVERGIDIGKEKKWRNIIILSIPAVIGGLFLFLGMLDFIPKVDWLMFAIMYPVIVTMLMILTPLAENIGAREQDHPRDRSRINYLKASIMLPLTWGLWFLPLLLTGRVYHMYVLFLINLSTSIIILTFLRARLSPL